MPPTHSHQLSRRVRVWVWHGRYAIAALACGLAVPMSIAAVRPAPPPTVPVAVSSRALSAGTVLTADDIRIAKVAPGMALTAAFTTVAAGQGRHVAVDIPGGVVLVPGIVTGELTSAAPEGTVVTPVQLDAAVSALLEPGMRVDLLAVTRDPVPDDAADQDPYLARSAVVMPGAPAKKGVGSAILGDADAGSMTLVAVRPEEAARLASAVGRGKISAVLVP